MNAGGYLARYRSPVFSFFLAVVFLAAVFAATRGDLASEKEWAEMEWTDIDYDIANGDGVYEEEKTAVAPLATDTVAPQKETVQPWLEYRIRRGDRMDKILQTMGTTAAQRETILAQKARSYRLLRVGDAIQFRLGDDNRLSQLRYKTGPEYYLTIARGADDVFWVEEKPPLLITAVAVNGGVIDSSLFAAADRRGIPDAAIEQLINALEWQVDFYREQRKGDSFRLIYEHIGDEDGELVKIKSLPAYEYISHLSGKPRVIRGIWNEQKQGYYSPAGESMQRAFLRAPLKFKRISSRFTHRRFHPILKKWRAHKGVDYAARSGSPVRSTADGVISLVERQRGYGRVVMIKHFNIYKTVYGHLSRFAKGIRRGKKVKQGQIIGYVGQTGLATGPHLHYEFRVRNKHKNPLSAAIPRQLPKLNQKELAAFKNTGEKYAKMLDAISAQ